MNMNNMFKNLFSPIQAGEELKSRTKEFLAVKTQEYAAGSARRRRHSLYAACACFLLVLIGGHWIYFVPIAEISIDINPSIEMSINRFDQVIFIDALNEDGRKLSNALDLKYMNYSDAIEQILNHGSIAALLNNDEIMTITVIGQNERQSAKILAGVEACTAQKHNTYCYSASPKEAAEAHEKGLSCGKYRAYQELQVLDSSITPETVQGMTMRELMEFIDGLLDENGNDNSSYDNRVNGHHGHGNGHNGGHSGGHGSAE